MDSDKDILSQINKMTTDVKIEFKNSSPATILDEYVSFVHTSKNSKIEGSFYIKDYCQGNIIGVKESKNQ